MKKLVLSLIMMAGMLLVASPAFATTVCTGRDANAYNLGKRQGAQYAAQAWRSSGQNPDEFEAVAALARGIVRRAIDRLPDDASSYNKCQAKGIAQGLCDGLADIQETVAGRCLLDGRLWGELSGDLYCALALEFGVVEAFDLIPVEPSSLCGDNFVSGCTAAFQTYADATCDEFTDELESGEEACYAAEYVSWVGGMCAYELE